MLTLSDAQASGRLNRISGVVPTSQDFIDLLNDACRMLMRRGNWWGTVKRLEACAYGCCVTWPRYVHTVLAAKKCGHPVTIANNWYSMREVTCLSECTSAFTRAAGVWRGELTFEDRNTSPVFNPIACNTGMWLQFYPGGKVDVDNKKTIRVFGVDTNGQDVYTKHPDGTIQEGEVIPFALPFGQSQTKFRHVTRVKKDPTLYPVRGYQWDGTQRWDMAYYMPSEQNPDYRVDYIRGCSCCQGSAPSKITALVKIQHISVMYPDDLVLIDNVDALAMMMQALNLSDAYDRKTSQANQLAAIEELNRDLESRFPDDQTTIVDNNLGPGVWCNRMF